MLRRLGCALLLAPVWLAVATPALPQSVDRELFRVLSNGSDVEQSCNFRVRAELASNMSRRGYRIRLPNWPLSVATIPGTGVTNAAATRTLTQSADLLQINQGGADTNCCIDILRSGNVTTFTPPATMVGGVITTQAEQDAVFAVNADIKIVTNIQFCGQVGQYVGCADGNSIIVVNSFAGGTTTFTNPATVAHEVGHWAGLCHVAQNCTPTCGQAGSCVDCGDPQSNNVMYYRLCAGAPNQGVISSAECSTYRSSAPQ